MPDLASCHCALLHATCTNTATQEDLLCDDCRWFKHNRLASPRPSHGVTTRRDNVNFTANPHYNDKAKARR